MCSKAAGEGEACSKIVRPVGMEISYFTSINAKQVTLGQLTKHVYNSESLDSIKGRLVMGRKIQ